MSTLILTVDSQEPDRLFACTVRAMRRGLDVTVAQLARASGIARRSIEDIEAGGAMTRAERHHLAVALGTLSSIRAPALFPMVTRRGDAGLTAHATADHLGHAQPSMTQDVYMGRRVTKPGAAKVLDR